MALEQKITVDASGALTGVATLNGTIASIGESLTKLNTDLGRTRQAFDSLESKLTSTLRSARDAAISLSRAANDANSSVQKAVSGLASIDTALEKRVIKVRELRAELQSLAGTSLAGGGGGGRGRGGAGGGAGAGGGPIDPSSVARLGDLSRFSEQLGRQLLIIGQSRAFFFIKDSIQEAVASAKELNERITEIQTISQSAGRSTESWAQSLVKVSNELGKPVAEIADAAYQALSNNVRGVRENVEAFTLTAGNFARVTRTSTVGAVDALSSVLNSYGLSADKAEQVSAKLFKGIELGRFRAEELPAALGKTAPIASQLGVSVDELTASFVALTDQGQSLNTSSTLVLNILNSLLKPNQELANFYKTQGVSSGQEFIQVNGGLANVLTLLATKSKGATKEITDLVSNIRGTRGIIGITSDIKRFTDSLTDIGGAGRSFQIAVQIEQNSSNRQIDQFVQRFKNQLTTGIGDSVVKGLAKLSNLDKSTGIITSGILPAAEFGAAVFAAGKLAEILGRTQVIQSAFLNTAIQTSRVVPLIGDGIATIGSNLGVIVAGLTAGFLIGQKIFQLTESETRLLEIANRRLKERNELLGASLNRRQTDAQQTTIDSFRVVQQRAAETQRGITQQFDIARLNVRTSFEQLSNSLTEFFARSRQTIQDINRDISRNLNEIDNSRKSLGEFRASAEKSFINLKIDLASPQQQLQLLDDEIDRLKNKGATLIIQGAKEPGTGGEEQIRQGRAELQEALQLAQKRVQVLQQIARENGSVLSSTIILNQLENDILRVSNAKIGAETELQRIKKEQTDQLKEQRVLEQTRLANLEKTVKQYSELQTKIGEGSIANDKTFARNGVFDPALVKAKLRELSSVINAELFKVDPGAAARFAADLAGNLRQSSEAINVALKDSDAKRQATAIIQEKDAAEKRFKAIQEVSNALSKSFSDSNAGGLATAQQSLQDLQNVLRQVSFTTLFESGSVAKAAFLGDLEVIKRTIESIRKEGTTEDGLLKLSPDALIRLNLANEALQKLQKATSGITDRNIGSTISDVSDQVNKAIKTNQELQSLVQANKEQELKILDIALSGGKNLDAALKDLSIGTSNNAILIDKALKDLAGRIDAAIPTSSNQVPIQANSHGGTIAGQGMDQLLGLFRPGEIVMNPGASRHFASQLQAMNNMSAIPYGTSSNPVSVGDVNVYVSGSNTSQQHVRDIGNGIRREIRRGNLKL